MTYLDSIIRFYGPYPRKSDGRKFVCLRYADGRRRSLSYPKFLVELLLGRELDQQQETIDHIDGNFNNNAWTNLRVVSRTKHTKDDAIYVKRVKIPCMLCGKVVIRSPGDIAHSLRIGRVGPFCSNRCSGKYGALTQKGARVPKSNLCNVKQTYYQKQKRNVTSVADLPGVILFNQDTVIAALKQQTEESIEINLAKTRQINAQRELKRNQAMAEQQKRKKERADRSCVVCGKNLTAIQTKFCSYKCSNKFQRRTEWPSARKLERLVWKYPTSYIAKNYGVSDKTIEKWCKNYGIAKPPRGYWAKLRAAVTQ